MGEHQNALDQIHPYSRVILHIKKGFRTIEYFTFVKDIQGSVIRIEPIMEDGEYVNLENKKFDILENDGVTLFQNATAETEHPGGFLLWAVNTEGLNTPENLRSSRRFITDDMCMINGNLCKIINISNGGFAFLSTKDFGTGEKVTLEYINCKQSARIVRVAYGKSNEKLYGCKVAKQSNSYKSLINKLEIDAMGKCLPGQL